MQRGSFYKMQARVAELRAEIDDLKKDGRKLRKLGLNTVALDGALGALESHGRELSRIVAAAEEEVVSLIGASHGGEEN